MRILHVIPSIAPRYGGPSRAVVEMCHASRECGMDVLIATTDADGAGRLDIEMGRSVSYLNVPVIFFPRQCSEAFKYSRPLARWIDSHVTEFDVVHIHAVFSHACLAAARACRRHKVPYIVRPLGTLDPWSLRQKRLRKKLFGHLGVKRMLKHAAVIHYTTGAEQKLAEESLGLGRGAVIPLGVEAELFDEGEPKNSEAVSLTPIKTPYVLVLSRLHRKKGLELLLPAFLKLVRQREFAGWQLVLAGEGEPEYVNSLKNLVRSCGGNGTVVFSGWLDGERRNAALRGASLLALPSYQENFGLSVVEALACGVPVLISPHVNLAAEINAVGAGWVSPLESVALEETLAEMLGDAKSRTRRGEIGREFVRSRFAWSAVAQDLAALYDSILSKGKTCDSKHA